LYLAIASLVKKTVLHIWRLFSKLPIRGILEDMLNKMDFSASVAPLPALIFPNPDIIFANITKADVDTAFG